MKDYELNLILKNICDEIDNLRKENNKLWEVIYKLQGIKND